MTTTEPIYLFIAVACVLVMAVTAFECVRLWLERDRDRITDTEIDSLPYTLLHGPKPDPLPDWVRVDGGDKTLYPFSGPATYLED